MAHGVYSKNTYSVLVQFPAILVLDGLDFLPLLLPRPARQFVCQIHIICADTVDTAATAASAAASGSSITALAAGRGA